MATILQKVAILQNGEKEYTGIFHDTLFKPSNSINAMYAMLTIMLTVSASAADCE